MTSRDEASEALRARPSWVPLLLVAAALFPVATGVFPPIVFYAALALAIAARLFRGVAPEWCFGASVSVAACFALLGVVDLVSRPFTRELLYSSDFEQFGDRNPRYPWFAHFPSNLDVRRPYIGNLARRVEDMDLSSSRELRIVTDDWGFRNAAVPDKNGEPLDLILLGDSYIMGSSVSQGDRISSILETEFGYRVYNMAVSATAPDAQFLLLRDHLDELPIDTETRILWFLNGANDLQGMRTGRHREESLDEIRAERLLAQLATRARTYRKRSPLRQLFDRFTSEGSDLHTGASRLALPSGDELLVYNMALSTVTRAPEVVGRGRKYELLVDALEHGIRLARDRGIELACFSVPAKSQAYAWGLSAPPGGKAGDAPRYYSLNALASQMSPEWEDPFVTSVRRSLAPHGVPLYDLLPPVRRAAKTSYELDGTLLWWRDDTHPSPAGQRAFATAIEKKLQRWSSGRGTRKTRQGRRKH